MNGPNTTTIVLKNTPFGHAKPRLRYKVWVIYLGGPIPCVAGLGKGCVFFMACELAPLARLRFLDVSGNLVTS